MTAPRRFHPASGFALLLGPLVVLSSCVTAPAPVPETPEIPVIRESQADWDRALPARLEVVRSRVSRCYEARVKEVETAAVEGVYRETTVPVLTGRVELEVPVDAKGAVGPPTWIIDELGDAPFRACVLRELGRLSIPPPPDREAVEVTFPFRFQLDAAPTE